MYSYQSMLYRASMDWVDPFDQQPEDSIKYVNEEHEFVHDLSIAQIGRVYALNKLSDVIPMDLYLKLPPDICDKLITGLVIGNEERFKLEAERKAQEEKDKLLEAQKSANKFNEIREKK